MATLPIMPQGGPVAPIGNPNILPGTGSATVPTASTNPLATTPIVPTTGTVPTSPTGTLPGVTSISSGLSTNNGSNTLAGDFSDSYGKGTGLALEGVLANLGTSTNGAVAATNQAINTQANLSRANIGSSLAAAGISPDSSVNALTTGDFDAQLASTVASTDAGMELSEQNTLINSLELEGAKHGPDGSTFDSILSGIEDAGQIAGSVAGFFA